MQRKLVLMVHRHENCNNLKGSFQLRTNVNFCQPSIIAQPVTLKKIKENVFPENLSQYYINHRNINIK